MSWKYRLFPTCILPHIVLQSTGHTVCVSPTKNAGMGFACAELEVCGYCCGDTVSILSCE